MKLSAFFFILLSLELINCQNPRNLKLAMDKDTFEKLTTAAKNTVFQIYGLTIDFGGRINVKEENEKFKLSVVVDDDPEIPSGNDQVIFNITNGKSYLPNIDFPPVDLELKVFGNACNLKEEFKAFSNMVANGYKNGKVIVYKISTDIVAQNRIKCFVNSDQGIEIGAFEIVIEDKNDEKTIKDTLKSWYEIIISALKVINKDVKVVSELITTIKGIKKDNSSSFLKIPSVLLFIILALL